jgi:hypothetical protein
MSEEQVGTGGQETAEKKWAVDIDGYKANPKRYKQRDGLAKAQLENKIITEGDTKDAEKSMSVMYLVNLYPLLRYGIAEAEGFNLPLTEEDFWELPEQFSLELAESIREVNPQYAVPFVELQKQMWKASMKAQESQPEDTSLSEQADSE